MEASTDYFISAIECNRIIYDKSSKDFKNVIKKEEAWVRIARATNMSVDSAKKRYASLRQKLCREKQKIEVQMRTKRKSGKPWAYFDRLHFLDEFIHPRTTYTNDTGFQDIQDNSNYADVEDVEDEIPLTVNDPPTDNFIEGADNSNSEETRQSDVRIITYNVGDVQDLGSMEFFELENCPTTFVSDYSGELTSFTPSILPPETNSPTDAPQSDISSNTPTQAPLSSSHSSTTSSQQVALPQNNTSSNKNATNSQQNQHTSTTSSQQVALPQNNTSSSKTATNPQQNRRNVESTSARSTSQSTSIQPSRATITSTATATSSSSTLYDKGMEAIRHKMDSCLTAINTKVTEKSQRSPHAPFLAYLGTKLPNVPKEKMMALEKEILDLVNSFCQ